MICFFLIKLSDINAILLRGITNPTSNLEVLYYILLHNL